ncbi:MAG: C39 family peptidase [Candidatus Kerfeldbacteria bacterium]|nr:C39 family peptidase [Candidatus Kerfeldbacteria bacterium]
MSWWHRPRPLSWVYAAILVVIVGVVGLSQRGTLREAWLNRQKQNLPSAVERTEFANSNTSTDLPAAANSTPTEPSATDTTEQNLPAEINLKVPFTVQAPHANWDDDHREFCEEASVLMVARYFQDRAIGDADQAERSLQDVKQWQIKNLGFYKDTTAVETARILREQFKLGDVEVISNPTLTNIKAEVAAGNLVIMPAAGRLIGNPYYRQPGPLYHMLVIKGYTKDGQLITNDPGTKRGADWAYQANVLMNAMHDWNDGDVVNGQRVVIVVRGS